MAIGDSRMLPRDCDVLAPDGSEVRVLVATSRCSAAHFSLHPGQTSVAVRHRSVEEVWYILSGCGEMWRSDGVSSDVLALAAGLCLTIPVGTAFQFRCTGDGPLTAFGVTIPPWPGASEAECVEGHWAMTS